MNFQSALKNLLCSLLCLLDLNIYCLVLNEFGLFLGNHVTDVNIYFSRKENKIQR